MNIKMLENRKGNQAYKILNRGNGDLFDVSQTQKANAAKKDNGGGGKHGSRYISVNKDVSESYSHYIKMDSIKANNNTPLQNYSKSP